MIKQQFALALFACVLPFSVYSNSCLRTVPYSGPLETNYSTCISTDPLFQNLDRRESSRSFLNVYEAGISEIPGGGFLLTLAKEVTNHERQEGMNNLIRIQLDQVLNEYENKITYVTDTSNPGTLIYTAQASIEAYNELGKLYRDKRLTDVEKEIVQDKMEKLRNVASLMVTRATVDMIGQNSQKSVRDLEVLKKQLIEKIEKIRSDEFELKSKIVEELKGSINSLYERLGKIENEIERKAIEEEIARAKGLIQKNINDRVGDIKEWAQFSSGLVSIYSLFEPEKASKLNQAINGVSQLTQAFIKFDNIDDMTTASIMGNYGAMAMGSVQVMSAFSNKRNSQNEAFNSIFRQLRQISMQITDLQKQMNTRFDGISGQLMSVEKNILMNLEGLHTKVDRIELMSDFGVDALKKIDSSLGKLIDLVTSNNIAAEVDQSYLHYVKKCLGNDTLSFNATKKDAAECYERITSWAKNKLSSPMLTSRIVEEQYRGRNLFEYQINDVFRDYKNFRPQSDTVQSLSNPLLLNDVSRVNGLLVENYKRVAGKNEIQAFNAFIENEKKNLNNFQRNLKSDFEYFEGLISSVKKELTSLHTKIRKSYDKVSIGSPSHYHREQLLSFISLLKNEIAYRSHVDGLDLAKAINPSEQVYFKELIYTQKTMKTMLARAEESLSQLDITGEGVFFANNCDPSHVLRIPIPVSSRFIINKVGIDLYKRLQINPSKFKACYSVEYLQDRKVKRGGTTYWYGKEALAGYTVGSKNQAKALGEYIAHAPSGIKFAFDGFSDLAYTYVGYTGNFIGKFRFVASFDEKEILDETMDMTQNYDTRLKLPLYNGATDPFAILGILSGANYYIDYAYSLQPYRGWVKHNYKENNIRELDPQIGKDTKDLAAFTDSIFSSVLFKNMSSAQRAVNMLSSLKLLNQSELYKGEEALLVSDLNTEFVKSLKLIDGTSLDEAMRKLTLAAYFRDPIAFDSKEEVSEAFSERWGIRSSSNLVKLYSELFQIDKRNESLKSVLDNQLSHIKVLEKEYISETAN